MRTVDSFTATDIEEMAKTADGPFSTKTRNYDDSLDVHVTVLKPDAIARSVEPHPFAYSAETIANRVHELEAQKSAARQVEAPTETREYAHAHEMDF